MGYGIANGLAALRWTYAGAGAPPPPAGLLGLNLTGPNPLRECGPPVVVRFALGAAATRARARLAVYDAQGRRVRSLYDGPATPGQWLGVEWDGHDGNGSALTPGMYFLALDAAGRRATARVVWLR
jgi:hypothetical protein